MSDLRQQMREYGLGGELDDADQDDLREALCQAASDRERMARAERALKIERAISDFWEAEADRYRDVSPVPPVAAPIEWWHAHRRAKA